jgi:very-short-patch-repair endonuclease
VDLYRDARRFPGTLRGRNAVLTWAELGQLGIRAGAIGWRAGSGRINRPHRGLYLVGAVRPDLLDLARAALRVAPAGAVLARQTAAALLGFGVTPAGGVHLVVGAGDPVPQRPGLTVHQSVVPVEVPVTVYDVPCTPPARTAIDLARASRRVDAISTLDAALAAGICAPDDLERELKLHSGLRGVRQARDLVRIATPRAECRQESHLRLILHDGGIRGLRAQYRVSGDRGLVTYVLALADPERKVGIEYDGASHLDPEHLRRDRARHNWLEEHGWRMRCFTDRDIYTRPTEVVRIVRAARRP